MNSSDGGTSPDSGNYYGESESNDGEDEDDGSIGDTARELKSLHLRKAGRFSKLKKQKKILMSPVYAPLERTIWFADIIRHLKKERAKPILLDPTTANQPIPLRPTPPLATIDPIRLVIKLNV